jgi:hypothetical protein
MLRLVMNDDVYEKTSCVCCVFSVVVLGFGMLMYCYLNSIAAEVGWAWYTRFREVLLVQRNVYENIS